MDRDSLLKSIAETGYNVGFGAKKHFASYDIVDNVPGSISFISIAVGILSLVFDGLSTKLPSATLTIAGVASLCVTHFAHRKDQYDQAGRDLTQLFNRLRDLYRSVQSGAEVSTAHAELLAIESQSYGLGVSKQVFGSDWYAHYKFFCQMQHDWIDEQKRFTWRDKFPFSLRASGVILVVVALAWCGFVAWEHFDLSCCIPLK